MKMDIGKFIFGMDIWFDHMSGPFLCQCLGIPIILERKIQFLRLMLIIALFYNKGGVDSVFFWDYGGFAMRKILVHAFAAAGLAAVMSVPAFPQCHLNNDIKLGDFCQSDG